MKIPSLPNSTPEEQGIPSSAVLHFVEAVEKKHLELHSFLLLRHGKNVAEGWWQPYRPEIPHMLFSLSKSFTSSAVGFAVAEGRISVEDTVISFFPDSQPEQVSDNLAAMRIKHLLTMSTGHAVDSTGALWQEPEGNWIKAFLAHPVENAPGKPFVYNSGATYMLSAIVQKVTGSTVLEYLRPRLYEPLGIENPTWETCPRGISAGGWGLSIRTEDIARFGQLYLQKGMWEGKQLLSREWIEQATRAQVPNGDNPESDWNQGYGYQFWRCRHNVYRGDGAFGQYCIVMPDQDAVLAITSGVGDMQAVLNLVWNYLLANMRPAPVRRNPAACEKLAEKLSCLALPALEKYGAPTSPVAGQVSGKRYLFKKNKSGVKAARLDFEADGGHLTLWSESGEDHVALGSTEWKQGKTSLFQMRAAQNPVMANGRWIDGNTFVINLRFNTTPFSWTITCQFHGDTLALRAKTNVSFGPTKLPRLLGYQE
jgi:CubicO group peptidase (beta-lactamase class C family)